MASLSQLNRNIRGGHPDRALAMLAPGDWLDGVDTDVGDTALTAAVYAKSLVLIDALLAAGAKIDARSRHGETPLHRACAMGLEVIARRLIEAGADVNARTLKRNSIDDGQSVLMKAVIGNTLPIVKLLMDKGADPLAKGDYGDTALSIAHSGRKRIAAYLEQALAAGESQEGLSIHDAVRIRDLRRLMLLASQGGPLDEHEPVHGATPLHLAAEITWLAGVEVLLTRGVPVDARDHQAQTPLMKIGLGKGAADIARALVKAGASVNAQTHTGRGPLTNASDIEVVKVLLAAGADPNQRNPVTGHTVFQYACLLEGPKILTAMIDAGADLAAVDNAGRGLEFYAKSNHRARKLIAERLGAALSPADRLRDTLKDLPTRAKDDAFQRYAERLGVAFNRKPAPWKQRKGAVYFHDVSLARIYAYFGEAMPESDDKRVHAAIMARLAVEARDTGAALFHLEAPADPDRKPLVLLPTPEPLAPLICCGTNANLRGDTNFVVEALLKISADNPFVIYGCGLDFAHAQLLDRSTDAAALAAKLIDLCPEFVEFGDRAGSMRSLATELSQTGRFGLWWD